MTPKGIKCDMKRTLIIIAILIASALIALLWVRIDTAITKNNYPTPERYNEPVELYSEEYSVPQDLVYAVIKIESKFKSDAMSERGALGLMQMLPETFFWLSKKTGDCYEDENLLYNPDISIKYGTYYLSWLYSRYNSWETAVAAYNAGHGNVDDWLKSDEYSKDGTLIYIPFKETREYVEKVKKARETYKELYFEN